MGVSKIRFKSLASTARFSDEHAMNEPLGQRSDCRIYGVFNGSADPCPAQANAPDVTSLPPVRESRKRHEAASGLFYGTRNR